MFENPRRSRQATNVPKILDLKSSSEQIYFRKLSLGAPDGCCTVLLVLNNSVSNLTNLYLFNQNVENLHIQTLPSNSPSPIPWPWDVCLELSYLQPPLWKNPGSAPGSWWIWITKTGFLLSANAMVSCKYVFETCWARLVCVFCGMFNYLQVQKTKNRFHLKLKLHQPWRIALSRLLFKYR